MIKCLRVAGKYNIVNGLIEHDSGMEMLMDFMDNVTCRRKVIKDKGGGGKFCLKEEKGLK